jgi:hypothetical protein
MPESVSMDRELSKNAFFRRRIKVAHYPDFLLVMVRGDHLAGFEPCRSSVLWRDAGRADRRH